MSEALCDRQHSAPWRAKPPRQKQYRAPRIRVQFEFLDGYVENRRRADVEALFSEAVAAAAEPANAIEQRFIAEADKWSRETSHVSSTTKMVLHPSYQTIIGMGFPVVPFLLRDMQRNRRFWFWALTHITGENPIPQQSAGDVDAMIAAWLNWGRQRRYL